MNLTCVYPGWAIWVKCSRPQYCRRSTGPNDEIYSKIFNGFNGYSVMNWHIWSGFGSDDSNMIDASGCPNAGISF